MPNDKFNFFIILCLSFGIYACTNSAFPQTATLSPKLPIATQTSVPVSTKTVTPKLTETVPPSSTALLQSTGEIISSWLPYNPNISNEGCNEFTAAIPIKDVKELSKEEIIKKLFEMYLNHFKFPNLGGRCRPEEFKIEDIHMDQIVAFTAKNQWVETTAWVEYSIKIDEVPSNWVAGNGELAPNGWISHKRLIIGFLEIDEQYVLILVGTGP